MCTDRLDDANTTRRGTEADAAVDQARSGVYEFDADDDDDELDDDEDDTDSLLLDEDEGAPNLVPEGHPQRVLAGRIEIFDKIGEGGMGAVWRGLHLKLERIVAVKILDETLSLRPDGRERFIREARALALLSHRNVVTIYDCDELPDGKLYLCMELLAGETFRDIIKRRKPLDPLEVIDAGLQVCDAVQAAHERGILHRDLTPSNIIRLNDDAKTIKVIDWGLCKYLDLFYVRSTQKYAAPPGSRMVTPLGCRFGTPEYMAPEMILRENPGPPSFGTDVYALAVVLYELLTGRHPFAFGKRQEPRPVRDFLPDFDYHDLEATLRAALRYCPDDRTPTMAELRDGLDLARECLLAQREEEAGTTAKGPRVSVPAELEQVAVAPPIPFPEPAERCTVEAVPEPPHEPAPRERVEAVHTGPVQTPPAEVPPTPPVPSRPRGRLEQVLLAGGLGLVAGIGATLAMWPVRPGETVQPAPEEALVVARMELERARADAAELRAGRCEAEAARQTPVVEPAPSSPTSAPGPFPSLSPNRPATRVLAASRGVGAGRPASPKAPPSLARLASKVRACARKGGIPDGPITVQVRRQGGVIGSVKVLKFSKDHPAVTCIDEVVRGADLPPSDRPLEDFTFSK